MALTDVKSEQIQSSVALAGSPTTTTQSASDNSTKIATTAYADTAVANLVASAPSALNTLDELAAALNDDASFSTTVTNSIATKLPLTGGTLTGDLDIKGGATPLGVYRTLAIAADTQSEIVLGSQDLSNNYVDAVKIRGLLKANKTDGELVFYTRNSGTLTTALTINSSQNATFAGTVSVGSTNVFNSSGVLQSAALSGEYSNALNFSHSSLQLIGHMFFNEFSSGRHYIHFKTAASTNQIDWRIQTNSSNNTIHSWYHDKIYFSTKVGIGASGSSSPDSLLELETAVTNASGGLLLTNTNASGYSTVQFKNTGGTAQTYTMALGGSSSAFTQKLYIYDDTDSAARVVLDHDGNVGIGTTDPDWALDVRGVNSGVQLQLGRSVGGSTGTAWFGADGTGIHIGPGTYSSGGYSVGAPALKLDTSGHLGLSTIPPNHASLGTLASVNAMNLIGYSTNGGYVGYNTYYNSGWKYQVAAASGLISFANNGDVTLRQATSGSQNAAISYTETLHIDNAGKVGIGIDPTHPIDLRAQYAPAGGVALRLHTDGSAWIQQKSSSSGVGSYQIGPAGDDWCVYDDTSSEYQIRVRDNATHKGSLQHKCHAHFQPHVSGSDAGQDEKGALAGAVYRLHNARIAPGAYSNNNYYVGVGRHYNTSTAFVEFKVNYVKATTAKCSYTVGNSADSQTRRAQLYWSLDGRRYSLGNTASFGSGQATASHEITTNMISNSDSTFSGSIYWRCYLIDNASVHETLIGWREFQFEAFAESMTFDGGFEQGVPDARKDQVTRSYGNVAGTEINYVPTSRPYGHTFTGTTNVAVSSNSTYQQLTNLGHGYLNEDLMKIVTTPVYGVQILADGQIYYSFSQDIVTAGSTSYARCYVRRHTYNNGSSAILGRHLITNTNGQWDGLTGSGIFDVKAGDIVSFYFEATNITNMDGGSWSYYNLLWWPVTVTGTGQAATGLAWAGEDAS